MDGGREGGRDRGKEGGTEERREGPRKRITAWVEVKNVEEEKERWKDSDEGEIIETKRQDNHKRC